MCTVSLVKKENGDFILTSNRDESPYRGTLYPDIYTVNDVKLIFPKDKQSGGTWIGVSGNNRVICLLNGAFVKHFRLSTYVKSRGIVVKQLLIANNIIEAINNYDLSGIEPFTIIVVDWSDTLQLFELVWDGTSKHHKNITESSQLWSSSTLYSNNMKAKREEWFKLFKKNNTLNALNLFKFHTTRDLNNLDYGLMMSRKSVKTTSVTQIEKRNTSIRMTFLDVETDEKNITIFDCLDH